MLVRVKELTSRSSRVLAFELGAPLVNVVDTNIPHSQAAFRLIGGLTWVGQQVSVSGVDATLLGADDTGDLVSLSVGTN